jgi:hypothetical protein
VGQARCKACRPHSAARDPSLPVHCPQRYLVSPASDINSDGVLDEQELEALFTKEVSVLEAMGSWDTHISHVTFWGILLVTVGPPRWGVQEKLQLPAALGTKKTCWSVHKSQSLLGVELQCVYQDGVLPWISYHFALDPAAGEGV